MQPKVQISSYENVDQGHTTYLLQVQIGPLDWQVRHRFRAFVKFDEDLRKESSNVQASLPPKNLFQRFNEDFLRERMQQLGEYMDSILSQVQLNTSPALNEFLGVTSKQSELDLIEKFERERQGFEEEKKKAITEALQDFQDKEKVKQDLWMAQIEREKNKSQELQVCITELKAKVEELEGQKSKSEEAITTLKTENEELRENVSKLELEKRDAESKLEISKNLINQLKKAPSAPLK